MVIGEPTIGDLYRSNLNEIRNKVHQTADAETLGLDPDDWTRQFVEQYSLEPIVSDVAKGFLTESESHRGLLCYQVPVQPSHALSEIFKHGLSGNRSSMSWTIKQFAYDPEKGLLMYACDCTESGIGWAKNAIESQLQWWNDAISQENSSFREQVSQIVKRHIENIKQHTSSLDNISKKMGIPLYKRADLEEIIIISPKIRKEIAPIMRVVSPSQKRWTLDEDKFKSIIELINRQSLQFERTPKVFSRLGEEDLRDIILSSLNAVFAGAAVGEAFQVLGKTDIHLRVTEGELFIAELKIWDGPESARFVTKQLLERLTWHESYGVAVIFSKRADFSTIRNTLFTTLSSIASIAGEAKLLSDHEIEANFRLPTDNTKIVEIHFLIYNLYLDYQGRS